MGLVNIANESEFDTVVLQSDKPVLIDFWASWCGPCKMVAPEIEAIAGQYEGKAGVVKVNVDEQQGLAAKYGVRSIPTLLLVKDGKELNRLVGFRPRQDIAAMLDQAL